MTLGITLAVALSTGVRAALRGRLNATIVAHANRPHAASGLARGARGAAAVAPGAREQSNLLCAKGALISCRCSLRARSNPTRRGFQQTRLRRLQALSKHAAAAPRAGFEPAAYSVGVRKVGRKRRHRKEREGQQRPAKGGIPGGCPVPAECPVRRADVPVWYLPRQLVLLVPDAMPK